MEETKRLAKILNIELAIVIIFVILVGGGMFLVFYQHNNQSAMIMGRIKDMEAIMQLKNMDKFVNEALIELFLFFLFLSTAFVVISRKFTAAFIKKIVLGLTNKTKELEEVKETLGETKTILEIKVQARTKELEEVSEGLEEQVKERTKELREKIAELERFQKLAVGREMKMIELKKEIQELKKAKVDSNLK